MPLYEYECDACGRRFEVIQKMSDAPLEACPSCGGPVRKLQSAPAFQFKGSGWYITDYAKKDQGGAEKTDGGANQSKDSKDSKDAAPTADKKADKPAESSKSSSSAESSSASSSASTLSSKS